jgi:hypothetical protein
MVLSFICVPNYRGLCGGILKFGKPIFFFRKSVANKGGLPNIRV